MMPILAVYVDLDLQYADEVAASNALPLQSTAEDSVANGHSSFMDALTRQHYTSNQFVTNGRNQTDKCSSACTKVNEQKRKDVNLAGAMPQLVSLAKSSKDANEVEMKGVSNDDGYGNKKMEKSSGKDSADVKKSDFNKEKKVIRHAGEYLSGNDISLSHENYYSQTNFTIFPAAKMSQQLDSNVPKGKSYLLTNVPELAEPGNAVTMPIATIGGDFESGSGIKSVPLKKDGENLAHGNIEPSSKNIFQEGLFADKDLSGKNKVDISEFSVSILDSHLESGLEEEADGDIGVQEISEKNRYTQNIEGKAYQDRVIRTASPASLNGLEMLGSVTTASGDSTHYSVGDKSEKIHTESLSEPEKKETKSIFMSDSVPANGRNNSQIIDAVGDSKNAASVSPSSSIFANPSTTSNLERRQVIDVTPETALAVMDSVAGTGHPPERLSDQSIVSGSHSLEVGISDPSHGWIQVRADIDTTGSIVATLGTSSTSSEQNLKDSLSDMSIYLSQQQVDISKMTVHVVPYAQMNQNAVQHSMSEGTSMNMHSGMQHQNGSPSHNAFHLFGNSHETPSPQVPIPRTLAHTKNERMFDGRLSIKA